MDDSCPQANSPHAHFRGTYLARRDSSVQLEYLAQRELPFERPAIKNLTPYEWLHEIGKLRRWNRQCQEARHG